MLIELINQSYETPQLISIVRVEEWDIIDDDGMKSEEKTSYSTQDDTLLFNPQTQSTMKSLVVVLHKCVEPLRNSDVICSSNVRRTQFVKGKSCHIIRS